MYFRIVRPGFIRIWVGARYLILGVRDGIWQVQEERPVFVSANEIQGEIGEQVVRVLFALAVCVFFKNLLFFVVP